MWFLFSRRHNRIARAVRFAKAVRRVRLYLELVERELKFMDDLFRESFFSSDEETVQHQVSSQSLHHLPNRQKTTLHAPSNTRFYTTSSPTRRLPIFRIAKTLHHNKCPRSLSLCSSKRPLLQPAALTLSYIS